VSCSSQVVVFQSHVFQSSIRLFFRKKIQHVRVIIFSHHYAEL
jgi:hypothetical protein